MDILCFLCWWYPIGLYQNAEVTNQEHSRAFLALLFVWMVMILASTFAHLLIAGTSQAQVAANISNILVALMLVFCG